MRKYYISDLDIEVNEGRSICFDIAMSRVYKHIVKKIDSTFPESKFIDWYMDGADKSFRWNSINYYWER